MWLALLLSLSFSCPVWAAQYYVKSGGNDNSDGLSDATAWATIGKVTAMVERGDVVLFRSQDTWTSPSLPVLAATSGVTYDGATYGSGGRAVLKASADWGYPQCGVVDLSVSDVTFRGFEVDGDNRNAYGIAIGNYPTEDISNIIVDDCVVHNIGPVSQQDPEIWLYGILVSSKHSSPVAVGNVIIRDTVVYDTYHEGIAVYPSWTRPNQRVDGVLITGCTVYNAAANSNGGGVGVAINNDADNVTVEFSHLYNNNGHGIWVRTSREAAVGAPNNMVVRYNIIHNNRYTGISFVNPQQLRMTGDFYGNLIYNNGEANPGGYGFEISVSGAGGAPSYGDSVLNFYNNTIYSVTNPNGLRYGVAIGPFSEPILELNVNFRNNIVYTSDYVPVLDRFGLLAHSNNLIYRASGASDVHVAAYTPVYVGYSRAKVSRWEESARMEDPGFFGGTLPTGFVGTYGRNLLPNSNYFAVAPGPAIDGGDILSSPYNGCINGAGSATPMIRPQGAGYDIGAYEYFPSVVQGVRLNSTLSHYGKAKLDDPLPP